MKKNIKIGQAILGKVPFKDGKTPDYARPYLVVRITEEYIFLLVVSSVYGKERKLLMASNKELQNFKPPFAKKTFVKLDSLTKISVSDLDQFRVLHNGEVLNQKELCEIINCLTF